MASFLVRSGGDPKAAAAFLERLNRLPSSHIGYCGEDYGEILHTIEADFSDLGFEKSFWVAEEEKVIIGALGLDISVEDREAGVWGPFVDPDYPFREVAERLWKKAVGSVVGKVSRFGFFTNEENFEAAAFADRLGAVRAGRHIVLQAERKEGRADRSAVPFEPCHEKAFRELHEASFPGTYLSSDEILDRLNGHYRLLVIPDESDGLKGYIYVEADPLHGEGAIEFLAVSTRHRRQGIATRLLRTGLAELFGHEKILSIRLTVEEGNEAALALYKAAGFRSVHRLTAWTMER
ncbi:GNAT family N-acetyltransferase [Bhargavaea ullalensis]|uniref:Ribosomal protein S18 acetylase RimI-like enzyme n=1 Tax=Bhargavaea ullalensis TaxID=1265685 RepID=A0ABV2GBQ7_9BACL